MVLKIAFIFSVPACNPPSDGIQYGFMVLNTPSMTYAQAVAECEATTKGQLAFFYSEMDVNTATGSIMGAWGITVWDIIGRKR
jgi:hypothetical protein